MQIFIFAALGEFSVAIFSFRYFLRPKSNQKGFCYRKNDGRFCYDLLKMPVSVAGGPLAFFSANLGKIAPRTAVFSEQFLFALTSH